MVRANATFQPYSMFNHVRDASQRRRACAAIARSLERGELTPIVDRVFPFAEVIDAYRYLESNAQSGKIVVEVQSA
jgi:NADPH:quinone reductase-like Zn-dependent oxidoreductase